MVNRSPRAGISNLARQSDLLDRVRDGIPAGFPEEIAGSIIEGAKVATAQLSQEVSANSTRK